MSAQMTAAEQNIADDKMRAEIAKLMAETAKINKEAMWYPMLLSTTMIGAIAAVIKVFF